MINSYRKLKKLKEGKLIGGVEHYLNLVNDKIHCKKLTGRKYPQNNY